MKKLSELKQEASEACIFRGHTLGSWYDRKYVGGRKTSSNRCHYCGAWVEVNNKPLPNDIDISGDAVALSCESIKGAS